MRDLFAVVDAVEGGAQASPFVVIEHAGAPRGKGRPRSMIMPRKGGKPFVHVYTDAATAEYEKALAWRAKAAMRGRPILDGPLAMRVFAMMPIPPSWPAREKDAALVGTKMHMGKPDGDNILKIVGDALNGVVYRDDAQLVRAMYSKEYAPMPGLIIEIFKL